MEGRIEDTFYKDLKREWRSGSIAVTTESFKNLPFVVSIKLTFVETWGTFHWYEKRFFRWGTKWTWPFHSKLFWKILNTFKGIALLILGLTGLMIGKSLYHLLFSLFPCSLMKYAVVSEKKNGKVLSTIFRKSAVGFAVKWHTCLQSHFVY